MVDLPNPRIDWSVLDGSEQAFHFYRSLGAVPMGEWTGYRLSGRAASTASFVAQMSTEVKSDLC